MRCCSRPLARLLAACVVLLACSATLLAQQSDRPTSLDIVPQSAAFYLASMNHEAQYNAIVESNAWQQVLETEVAQRMRRAYRSGRRRGWSQFGYGNPFAEYLRGYSESVGSVQGKMAMSFLAEIFGNEVFIYGEGDCVPAAEAVANFYRRSGEALEGVYFEQISESDIKSLLSIAREEFDGINTPTLVMGTVLDNPQLVESLLQMAEAGIDQMIGQIPPDMDYVLDGYEVVEQGDLYMLSLQLDSSKLPWDELEGDPDFEPFLDDIKGLLEGKSFNLSFGIKGQFLLVAAGPSIDHIHNIGNGDLLIDHPKMAPVKAAAAEHAMTSVSWTSEQVAISSYENMGGIVDAMVTWAALGMQAAEEQGMDFELDGLMADIKMDAEEFKADMMAAAPKPGAALSFSYMFEHGIEGFAYNWAENKYLDSSQPLTLLRHVGEEPTLLAVARENEASQEQFAVARKWGGKAFDYLRKYGPRQMPNEEARVFRDFTSELRDVLSEVADSTEQNLLGATKNCESAFVLDFSTAKESWHDMMPRSDRPLPMPAMAVVIEHNDAEKIRAAGDSYLEAARDILGMIRELPDMQMPPYIQIYPPEHETVEGGDMYVYRFPPEAGLDSEVAFHALLSDNLLILGISTDQSQRLLVENMPMFEGVLSDRSQPLMAAFYYDNTRLIDALHAWAMYGLDVARDEGLEIMPRVEGAENETLIFTEDELLDALDKVVDLLKCMESCSSISYMDDGAQVTHYQLRFSDVAAND